MAQHLRKEPPDAINSAGEMLIALAAPGAHLATMWAAIATTRNPVSPGASSKSCRMLTDYISPNLDSTSSTAEILILSKASNSAALHSLSKHIAWQVTETGIVEHVTEYKPVHHIRFVCLSFRP